MNWVREIKDGGESLQGKETEVGLLRVDGYKGGITRVILRAGEEEWVGVGSRVEGGGMK